MKLKAGLLTLSIVLAVLVVSVAVYRRWHVRTIQGYIGETVAEMLKQNQQAMNLQKRYDNSPIIFPDNDLSGENFHFIFNQPGAEIPLPAARLIWFTQYAGVITEVTVNTSAQKLSLADLYRELHELRASLVGARWGETQPLPSFNELQATIARSEGTTNNLAATKFKKGNAEAVIMLNTPGAVVTPEKTDQTAFVAEIWFHDEVLGKQQYDKMTAARLQVNGKDISLPMSYWVK